MVDPAPPPSTRPALAVDVVLLAILDGTPRTLLLRRAEPPFAGHWSLPGGFVQPGERLGDAALRLLRDKAGVGPVHLEQLYSFDAIDRDPRARVVSIGYLALLPPAAFAAIPAGQDLLHARLDAEGEVADGVDLAFDHAEILALTMRRLRGKLDYSDVGFALLPPEFTLRQLQDVHEALRGTALNKPAFRRRMIDRGWITPTGGREANASHRPAALYRYQPLQD